MIRIFRKVAVSYTQRAKFSGPARAAKKGGFGKVLVCVAALFICGCTGGDPDSQKDSVLIRTDRHTITLAQFERAFEAARIAYSDERMVAPRVIREAQLRLLDQLVEETTIRRRAEELGIALTEAELEAAIDKIKADYPEDAFDQMLLESAIPYSLWKDRLRMRLLVEKVVDQELVQPLTITAREIEAYYKAHEDEFAAKADATPATDLEHKIVERLRRDKVEAAYPQWVDGLRRRYEIEINWDLWKRFQGTDDN
jgi:hypothetical protein